MKEPGGSWDPTTRFTGRVEDYVASRPGYPPEMIPLLVRETGLRPTWMVADLGSGTGLSARPFLENGNLVYGVEPNDGMRRAAEVALGHLPGFASQRGRAEATGLPEGSVDLAVAAQAFHWFDAEAAGREAARILRPGGWRVVVWNSRVVGDPFMDAYEHFLLEHGTDYRAVRHDHVSPDALRFFLGAPPRRTLLPNSQTFDLAGLTARVRSSSFTPPPGDPLHAPMMDDLERLFAAHAVGGEVTFLYETELYLPHR